MFDLRKYSDEVQVTARIQLKKLEEEVMQKMHQDFLAFMKVLRDVDKSKQLHLRESYPTYFPMWEKELNEYINWWAKKQNMMAPQVENHIEPPKPKLKFGKENASNV